MSDATSLRRKLASTDMTAANIQSSAAAMISLYDKPLGPQTAVSEWRNILQSAQTSQLLPLLYVANEVLQTSKRNRGNKFLEAFGPVLGNSLKFICERDPSLIEKVRRTAKIWGDRSVFSVRFVGDVLAGLEGLRRVKNEPQTSTLTNSAQASTVPPSSSSGKTRSDMPASSTSAPSGDSDNDMFQNSDEEEDRDGIYEEKNSMFGISSGPSLLNVSNFRVTAQTTSTASKGTTLFGANKRRREAEKTSKSPKKSKPTQKKGKNILSTSNFVELIAQLFRMDEQYKSIQNSISSIESSAVLNNEKNEIVEVGDELIQLHTSVNTMKNSLIQNKATLWKIANGKHEIENQLKKYVVWLKGGLSADVDELKLCDLLEEKLLLLQVVQADAVAARDALFEQEEKKKMEAEEEARKEAEEEELRKSLEKIQKDKAPKEGMVWNKVAREYQYLDTSENWRD